MSIQDAFIKDIEQALTDFGMNPTQFGREALNDPTFVFELRNGRSVGVTLMDRVYQFIATRKGEAAQSEALQRGRAVLPSTKRPSAKDAAA